MPKLNFSMDVKASPEEVWKALWDDANYRKWTSAFSEGSYAVSDWKQGSKILFLGPGGTAGMHSIIEKIIPNEYMSFKHMGEVKDGKEIPASESSWSGAMENYTLKKIGDSTKLTIDVDVIDEYADYFKGAFPKAMELLKEIAEMDAVHH